MRKTVRVIALVAASLMLSGCGFFDRKVASITGYSRMCVDGVSYLQFTSGVTVQYTTDGRIKTCN